MTRGYDGGDCGGGGMRYHTTTDDMLTITVTLEKKPHGHQSRRSRPSRPGATHGLPPSPSSPAHERIHTMFQTERRRISQWGDTITAPPAWNVQATGEQARCAYLALCLRLLRFKRLILFFLHCVQAKRRAK